jgi:hypothetical protein
MGGSLITSATTDFYMTSTMDEATLALLGADMNKGYETMGDKFSFATKWDSPIWFKNTTFFN